MKLQLNTTTMKVEPVEEKKVTAKGGYTKISIDNRYIDKVNDFIEEDGIEIGGETDAAQKVALTKVIKFYVESALDQFIKVREASSE